MQAITWPCEVVGDVVQERVRWVVANTSAKDRAGTIFPPSGCQVGNFAKNPVVTWGHAELQGEVRKVDPDEIVGRAPAVRYEPEADRIVVAVEFESGNALADRILAKYDSGFLKACSITAKPLETHTEGDTQVADSWDLWALSFCIVGSNPEALALRAAIEDKNPMNEEMLKALGLESGATFEQCLQALVTQLADTPEKQALALAVMSMKAMGGDAPAVAAPAPVADAAVAAAAPCADKAADAPVPPAGDGKKDDAEMRAAKLAIATLKSENSQLAARAASAPQQTAEQWVDEQIKANRWPLSGRANLIAERTRAPEVAARSVAMLSGHTFLPHQESLRSLAGSLGNAAARSANFGNDPARLPDVGAAAKERAKASAKSVRERANKLSSSATPMADVKGRA